MLGEDIGDRLRVLPRQDLTGQYDDARINVVLEGVYSAYTVFCIRVL